MTDQELIEYARTWPISTPGTGSMAHLPLINHKLPLLLAQRLEEVLAERDQALASLVRLERQHAE